MESTVAKPAAKLCGMYPILTTPYHDDESLDFASMKKLVDYLIEEGVDGVVTLANASEGHVMSDAEKQRVAREVIQTVDGRIPVIISITHFSSRIAAEKAAWAEKEGADGVMTLPPFFGKWRSSLGQIRDYLKTISDAVDIPLILQDHPLTDINLSASDLCGLVDDVPGLDYLKMEVDSSAIKVREVMASVRENFQGIFTGMGGLRLFWELEAGAIGCMPGCVPAKAVADMIHLHWEGKRDESFELFRTWMPFLLWMLQYGRRDVIKEYLVMKDILESPKLREPSISVWNDWARTQYEYLLEKCEV